MWQVYVFLAVVFMGFNSFIVKKLVKTVNPSVVMLYQFLLAAPLVFSYLLLSSWDFTFNPFLILIGFGYFCSLTFFYISLIKGSLTKSGPIFTLNLLVTAILGFILLRETLNWKIAAGLLFGLLSVYLLGSGKK